MNFKSILKEIVEYKNENYSKVEGKSLKDLETELYIVYNNYADYNENDTFEEMIKKFAEDDFYNLHYVAQRYLELTVEDESDYHSEVCPQCNGRVSELVRNEYQYSMGDQEMPEYICKDCLRNLKYEI